MISTYDFGLRSVKKVLSFELAVFVKDIGCFAYFYGGTSVFTKHWS